jgi:formylglycine-generating enzyme required for sulfatase activity
MAKVYIPGGKFVMGKDDNQSDANPRHTVNLDAYWIDRTTVTNAMYARCIGAGVCGNPCSQETNPHFYDSAFANHPVIYITWSDAAKYCKWVSGRLPTEAEWERAASGNDDRTYAWGDDDPAPNLTNVDNYHSGTTEVGTHPDGASPFGVLDMGSNVREWVADWYDPNYYHHSPEKNPKGPDTGEKHVLRGAGWGDPANYSQVHRRFSHVPESAGINRGFRCAFSP